MSTISEDLLTRLNTQPARSARDPNELGQSDFLDLMIAQVRNQDPFEPMENGEFIAQLAQFSMSEGIEDMQRSLAEMTDSLTSSQLLGASALVGRSVLAPGNSAVTASAGTEVQGALLLDEPASSAVVNVFDAAGALVSRIEVDPTASGPATFTWNGRTAQGTPAAPGTYTLTATAQIDGESVAIQTALRRDISSITLGASGLGEVQLNLDNGSSVKLASVREFF
jgi:flagellar basal-body rod modification protein FlgD